MSNKTSDKDVGNIEDDDVKILEEFAEICKEGLAYYDQTREGESLERILSEREQMLKEREKYTIRLTDEEYRKVIENAQMDTSNDKVIAIKFAVMQQQINEKDKRIQELEEEVLDERERAMHYEEDYQKAKDEQKIIMANSIPNQVVIDAINKHKLAYEELGIKYTNTHYEDDEVRARDFYMIVAEDRIVQVLQELLEGEK